MMQAERIAPSQWMVALDDGRKQKVILPADSDTADAAIAAVEEAQAPPSASEIAEQRASAAASECARRIVDVVSETDQLRLLTMLVAGDLSEAQVVTWTAGQEWIQQMRGTWPVMPVDADIYDDASWPAPPAGLADLARTT